MISKHDEKTFKINFTYFFFIFNQGEESNSSANKCMLKVAMYAAQLENYERAIRIYEQVNIILLNIFFMHDTT